MFTSRIERDSQRFTSVEVCFEGGNRLRNSDLVVTKI